MMKRALALASLGALFQAAGPELIRAEKQPTLFDPPPPPEPQRTDNRLKKSKTKASAPQRQFYTTKELHRRATNSQNFANNKLSGIPKADLDRLFAAAERRAKRNAKRGS